MHFAFVVSSGLGYQIPNLFQNDSSFNDFENALQLLRENGFEGVELNLNFDDQSLLTKIKESIHRSGLKLAAVGTGLLYAMNRLSFTDPNPDKRAMALSIVKALLRFAASEHAVVVIGLVRGSPLSDMDAVRELRQNLVECDRAAKEYGVRIALEALNRYETTLLNTAIDAATLIREERLAATGLLLDTFHMNIEEESMDETLRKHIQKLAHFHIADSNRWPPGYGHLKLEELLRILDISGYHGWVSAEPLPKPNNVKAVTDTAQFLRTHNFMRA
jgi:sugar phosphate isomerase/epimerase